MEGQLIMYTMFGLSQKNRKQTVFATGDSFGVFLSLYDRTQAIRLSVFNRLLLPRVRMFYPLHRRSSLKGLFNTEELGKYKERVKETVKWVDRQTGRQKDRQTDRQADKYRRGKRDKSLIQKSPRLAIRGGVFWRRRNENFRLQLKGRGGGSTGSTE